MFSLCKSGSPVVSGSPEFYDMWHGYECENWCEKQNCVIFMQFFLKKDFLVFRCDLRLMIIGYSQPEVVPSLFSLNWKAGWIKSQNRVRKSLKFDMNMFGAQWH